MFSKVGFEMLSNGGFSNVFRVSKVSKGFQTFSKEVFQMCFFSNVLKRHVFPSLSLFMAFQVSLNRVLK